MNKLILATAALLFAVTVGCGTITKSSKAEIRFKSAPSGASIMNNGVEIGKTPAALKLARNTNHTLVFKLDGYRDVNVEVTKKFDFVTSILGNAIFGGIIGLVVDLSTGAAYSLTPADIEANFDKISAMSRIDKSALKKGEYTVVMLTSEEWAAIKAAK